MSSILTNLSAMSAVANLSATQAALATTQSQISTGLKVGSAEDNASYWSIATSMRSDVGALGAVSDSINLGQSVVTTAAQAVSSSIGILNQMKDLVVTAQTAGQDPSTINTQLSQLQAQLQSFSQTATFNGVNILAPSSASTGDVFVVTSFSKDATGTVTVGSTDISLGTALYNGGAGLLDGSSPLGTNISTMTVGTDPTTLANQQQDLETAIGELTADASKLGSIQSNLTAQTTFTQTLSDSLTSGVGSLVDANMNEASTRLNALQTQQQLGIQSLSIANSNSQLILKLFQ
ncbi:flagellin [Beijerinckia sp. L45]|uniref:flagellin N-terminal helical domain-containing protein n=1 Tax=Beijerinckia sp. L45 TaxID=1641855 RepID=UPI00131D5814|nr:flagellin [Beijerinckia sp. L45]